MIRYSDDASSASGGVLAAGALSSLSKATFLPAGATEALDLKDPDFWSKLGLVEDPAAAASRKRNALILPENAVRAARVRAASKQNLYRLSKERAPKRKQMTEDEELEYFARCAEEAEGDDDEDNLDNLDNDDDSDDDSDEDDNDEEGAGGTGSTGKRRKRRSEDDADGAFPKCAACVVRHAGGRHESMNGTENSRIFGKHHLFFHRTPQTSSGRVSATLVHRFLQETIFEKCRLLHLSLHLRV